MATVKYYGMACDIAEHENLRLAKHERGHYEVHQMNDYSSYKEVARFEARDDNEAIVYFYMRYTPVYL